MATTPAQLLIDAKLVVEKMQEWLYRNPISAKWHPEGILFSSPDDDTLCLWTDGKIWVHNWVDVIEVVNPVVPVLPTPTPGDPVETPIFTWGATSERYKGYGKVTYTATAVNATLLTYSLDATSLAGGCTINSSIGEVIYDPTYSGTLVVTCSASGLSGPETATHTVTISEPVVGVPIPVDEIVLPADTTPIHRVFDVYGGEVTLSDDFIHNIFAEIAISETDTIANIIITKEYLRENSKAGYLYIFMGIVNGKDSGRSFALDFANAGFISRVIPQDQTRSVETDLACTLDGFGDNTGYQTGNTQAQIKRVGSEVWEDVGAPVPFNRINITTCPVPGPPPEPTFPYRASFSIGTSAYNMATDTNIPYVSGKRTRIQTPLLAGSNRLFISIPSDKTLESVENNMSVDITDKYAVNGETDNRGLYHDNVVYRGSNVFITTDKVATFYITIS